MEREKLITMVHGLQKGDSDAMALMYENFRDDFYYYILKTVDKDCELAEDLMQDTFVYIIEKIQDLEEPAAFVTWAKKIAHSKCTDYFKKRKDILLDENEDGRTLMDIQEEEDYEFIPDEVLEKEELKRTILDMIDELPEEQRSALLLRYYNEISVKEIAQVQNVSEGTVKSRLNYARKAIKQSVEAYEKKNGIKLHCAGVIPMLLWLFRQYRIANKLSLTKDLAGQTFITTAAQGTAAAGMTLAGGSSASGSASGAMGGAAASGGANGAVTSVATAEVTKVAVGAGVKAATTALSTKIVAGVVAAAVAIGGLTAGLTAGNKKEQEAENIQPTTVISQEATEQSEIAGEEAIPETIPPCDTHTWKPLYCIYEVETVVIPGIFYGCTTCGATVLGQGCPHPEVTTEEVSYDYGTFTKDICSLCYDGVMANYRQYLTAPGGEGFPAFTWPNTYRDAEPVETDGCEHNWEVVDSKIVPTELDGSTYNVCTKTYECTRCAEQLVGNSAHIAYDEDGVCKICKYLNTQDSECDHAQVFTCYSKSIFGGTRYYLICRECNTPVLEGIPIEMEDTEIDEGTESADLNLQDYLDFTKSWAINDPMQHQFCVFAFAEDGTFHCVIYRQNSGYILGFHGTYVVNGDNVEFTFAFDDGETSEPFIYFFNRANNAFWQVSENGLLPNEEVGMIYPLINDEWLPTAEAVIAMAQQTSEYDGL